MGTASADASRPPSEDIIINAPMSFVGAAQRSFRLRRVTFNPPCVANILMTTLAIILTFVWLVAVACWYTIFLGLPLVLYRRLRRGSRRAKQESLQYFEHFERLAALRSKEGE